MPGLRALALAPLLLLGACDEPEVLTSTALNMRSAEGGFLGVDVLITDEAGEAIPCGVGELDVTVDVRRPDGDWQPLASGDLHVSCTGPGHGDVAVVMDNSGSELGHLDLLKQGARAIADGVLPQGGRASLVRASTQSEVLQPLTDDAAAVDTAIDELFITNGWTALWDGVRMGNETLGAAAAPAGGFSDLADFCDASRKLGIVVFTDGQDNNSSGENMDTESELIDDGLNTTLQDVLSLQVQGVSTPIYTVGLGDEVDAAALQAISEASGGGFLPIEYAEQVPDAFGLIADYFDAGHQVCARLPEQECGLWEVRVRHTWTHEGQQASGERLGTIDVPCGSVTPQGRAATLLLTMSNDGFPEATAATLARNTVRWVSPVFDPRVAVVLDDSHHGEDADDAGFVADLLIADGFDVSFLDEPRAGLGEEALDGFDVTWFSNPGYPIDDQSSYERLLAFRASGGGVVLQGDDMARSYARAFPIDELTRLEYRGNGTNTCGQRTDNNRGAEFSVLFADTNHALIDGLAGTSFPYGNDIDDSVTVDGEVLATASLPGASCPSERPAVVAWDPAR